MPSAPLSLPDFEAAANRARHKLSPTKLEELHRIHKLLHEMCVEVRTGRQYDAEPAHIFRPIELQR